MVEQENPYSKLQPRELNDEFHKLFGLMSANQISMLGTIIGDESIEMGDQERAIYEGDLQFLYPDKEMALEQVEADLDETTKEILIQQARGEVAREKRMTFGATLLVKLEDFMPYIKGTDSYKEYMRREIKRCIRDGVSEGGKNHWLYGDDNLGGNFHPETVIKIEESSFQIFIKDIEWYGIDPMMVMGRIFEADYDNDPTYREMVDLARKWKIEFIDHYKRAPLDVGGQEIQIP